jgi:predicted N-formylglutamate amidohydrolase
VRRALKSHAVVHLGVHTFTPIWNGHPRTVDIGVLFDPHRAFETGVAGALVDALRSMLPRLRVHRNRPSRGWTDGLTTTLRGVFPASRYAGVELEVSQELAGRKDWGAFQRTIAAAVRDATRR